MCNISKQSRTATPLASAQSQVRGPRDWPCQRAWVQGCGVRQPSDSDFFPRQPLEKPRFPMDGVCTQLLSLQIQICKMKSGWVQALAGKGADDSLERGKLCKFYGSKRRAHNLRRLGTGRGSDKRAESVFRLRVLRHTVVDGLIDLCIAETPSLELCAADTMLAP